MTVVFRLKMLACLTAATLCLVTVASNEANAQIIVRLGTPNSYYNPYGGGYSTEYYGGRAYGYTGYGRVPYGYGAPSGVYVYPPSAAYGRGVYYRGGLATPSRTYGRTYGRTYFRSGPRYYSPYGLGGR
jgi:hypothetical protein